MRKVNKKIAKVDSRNCNELFQSSSSDFQVQAMTCLIVASDFNCESRMNGIARRFLLGILISFQFIVNALAAIPRIVQCKMHFPREIHCCDLQTMRLEIRKNPLQGTMEAGSMRKDDAWADNVSC